MKLFSFETILMLVVLAFSFMTLWSTIQRARKLGEKVIGTLSGLKYSDKVQFILILFLAIFTITAFQFNTATENTMILFYIAFAVAMIIFITNSMYIAFIPKGFFKNGIATYAGVLSYDEVLTYDIVENPKNDTVKVRFNPKKSIFGSNSYIIIQSSDTSEIKAYMKKHCSFKKKNYTPPPKKKK